MRSHPAILDAIRQHPEISRAALTGSRARSAAVDEYGDLDVLLLARDLSAVRDIASWFPQPEDILICELHLTNYCTVLLIGFEKIDLAILPADAPPSNWIVHDYQVIKGDDLFAAQLAAAAAEPRLRRAAHLHPDVCLDNVLLLLVTAVHRVKRGESLSAHGFLAMACDMVAALERKQQGCAADADWLDVRRRLEQSKPELAAVLHGCLFAPPLDGVKRLAQALPQRCAEPLNDQQRVVLEYLASA